MQTTKYHIPPTISKAMLDKEGVDEARLQDMLLRSTRITHVDGNRRYHDYLFMVEGRSLWSVSKLILMSEAITSVAKPKPVLKPTTEPKVISALEKPAKHKYVPPVLAGIPCDHCHGEGKVSVFDQCPHCDGDPAGCSKCDQGLIPAFITCPLCKGAKVKLKKSG